VYYAEVRSAIFLPRESDVVPNHLLNLLDEPGYSAVIRIMEEETTPAHLRRRNPEPLAQYSDEDIAAALALILAGRREAVQEPPDAGEPEPADAEVEFRRAEYRALRTSRADEDLVIRTPAMQNYAVSVRAFFSRITLVEKLRETRAFAGFSRLLAEDGRTLAQKKAALWREMPRRTRSWLPAHVVFGEGLFIEFDPNGVAQWERRPEVMNRAALLADRYARLLRIRHFRQRAVTPRLVLVHTFAHLLINRLIFECGYASASLRERLYVSEGPEAAMAGVLIYTAAGDSEGTMGGLVRMGRHGHLEPVVQRALETAEWCSADPVCAETAAQGPESCNLAACHNCALVPETACEQFNRFLDRALVVPTVHDPDLAFFRGVAPA
jgi:hypothetical protein